MVAHTHLAVQHLIAPLFIKEGLKKRCPVATMPGVFQYAPGEIAAVAQGLADSGVKAVILFGIPARKDDIGSGAWAEKGVVQQAVRAIKKGVPGMLVIADVCLCEYTAHGHCGVLTQEGRVENDATLPLLARVALSLVQAGADIIAPSDMMDGRIACIRSALDADGYAHIPIMSYAVKYASSFYGPFRDAAENAPHPGDRRSYQMDPRNADEAEKEAMLDQSEGADLLIVKPAGPYLDIIRRVSQVTYLPVVGYQVSGEYALIKAAAAAGMIDEKAVTLESLIAIRRAGAQMIISYFTPQAVAWL
jgi:porphobilinogen synthase